MRFDGTPQHGIDDAPARFCTTHWSVVLRAGEADDLHGTAALEELCRTYWLPAYAFVRRRGHGVEDAQDLTQAFFAELIARRDFTQADRAKGKFRSFLLACLNHFLAKDWRDRNALKRGGGQLIVPLDLVGAEESLIAEATSEMSPERHFDRRWAVTVMAQALERLRLEMVRATKGPLYDELRVYLTEGTGGYEGVSQRLGMSPTAVATAVHRLRGRFRELVRETLAQTVSTQLELDEEMRYLLEVLAR